MTTRTSTLLIASAFAAAAFTLSAQAAEPDTGAQQRQSSAQATTQKSPTVKPVRTLDSDWWQKERALDDGYGDVR